MSQPPASLDRRSIIVGAGASLALAAAPAALQAASKSSSSMIVETTAGKFQGEPDAGVLAFHGLPYGASTAGANRFMPPAKPTAWTGVRTSPPRRVIAPQNDPNPGPAPPAGPFDAILGGVSTADALESEDCLLLDIWTPALDGAKRPVMVWLHGGGFGIGAGSLPAYNGARLSQTGDVVVINITHRLSALGYLHLGDLAGPEFAASGLAGMLDIVLALEWVRDNVERFGGNPRQVMIFGESGGGGKVGILMAMPRAKDLFHRAAIQSGAMRRVMERPEATQLARAFLTELSLAHNQAQELQKLPLSRLMAASFSSLRRSGLPPMMGFMPVLDGTILPQHPWDPVASRLSADVPLIVGSNRTETTLFSMGDLPAFSLDDASLRARLTSSLGEQAANAAIGLYKSLYPTDNPSDLYFKITTDRGAGAQAIRVAELKAGQGGAPVYLYAFNFTTPVVNNMLRSTHGLEVPMVFNDPASKTNIALTGGGQGADEVATAMSAAWVAFAHSGKPATASLLWPAFDPVRRATMTFNVASAAADDPSRAIRRFWVEASDRMM